MPEGMQSFLLNVGEKLVPLLRESKFAESGRLTPEEFVAAGDYLVFKCPTWSWSAGARDRQKPYLPADKQFLITRNVPAINADALAALTEAGTAPDDFKTISLGSDAVAEISDARDSVVDDRTTGDDIPDMEDFAEPNLVLAATAVDPALHQAPPPSTTTTTTTQSFDLYITYDKYYQTPRIWLSGYTSAGQQLAPERVMQMISQDHANKTVTIEDFAHLDAAMASVHPCRHAAVMHKILQQYRDAGKDIRVDQYMIVFLKFISSILPTVDYDYTMSME